MPLNIACSQCGKKYQVADQVVGKQVRCQGCGTIFVAAQPPAKAVAGLQGLDPLDDLTLAPLPQSPATLPRSSGAILPSTGLGSSSKSLNPLGSLPAKAPGAAWPQGDVSNPSGGPPDSTMRLISGGMAVAGCFLLAVNFFMDRTQGAVYIVALLLAPLALIMGVAGMISPNIVRAAGKFGAHLPWHYKAIGAGLMVLYLIVLGLIALGLYSSGYFNV